MSQLGKFINAGSIGAVGTITGDVGGAVGPDGVANLNLVGSGPILVTGNPGAFTLTISISDATTSAVGVVELATSAETIAGTDTTRAIVPSGLTAKLGTQTANAVPFGAGTASAFGWTSAGTNGQLLIAATAGSPDFATLSSSGGTITITPGPNSLNIETSGATSNSFPTDSGTATPALGVLNILGLAGRNISTSGAGNTVSVAVSGTTQYGVQVGDATGSLDSLAVGATNTVLKGNTGANPSWGQVDLTSDVTGVLPVDNGGTGVASITDHSLIVGSGTAAVTELGVAGNGEIPIGSAGADPVLGAITATDGTLTVTNGAGTIDIEAGTGLRIMSGFATWSGGSPYFDDTTLGQFTVSQAGTGYIKGEPVTWTAPQTVTGLTAGNTYYIYMDNTGTIQKTTTYSESLFRDNVVLFECMRDSTSGTNIQQTVKENHPYQFPYSTSIWAHDTIGPVIADNQNGANITLNGTQKIEISGADELEDHGLETTIPDSGGVAEVFNQYFTNGSGKWARYASSDTFDGTWNNAGTATALGANKYSVYRLYVSKDDLNTTTPQYFAVLGDAQYNNLTAAQTAVANDSIPTSTGELARLEMAQLGFIIFEESSTSIVDVIIAKETARTSFSGATSTGAALVLTDTTNFDHILSAADTTVQSALETIDDLTFAGDGGTAQAASAVFTFAGGNNLTSAAAGSTVTFDVDGNVADSFTSDSGSAVPALGILTVSGGSGINTSASGSTLTITATGAVSNEFEDNVFRIIDDGDNSRKLAFQCSGITTSTVRTWTVDDRDIDFDAVATTYATDGGNATAAAGTITFAGGTNVTTSGSGSTVTINATGGGGGLTWNEVTGTSQSAAVDNGYITNNAGLVTVTLPDTAALGSVVRICGKGAGGWKLAQNASESIIWDEDSSTTVGVGGYLASTDDYDAVEVLCTVANTTWTVLTSKGNITVV